MHGVSLGAADMRNANVPTDTAKRPELVDGIERLKRIANGAADLGEQLNGQANRLFGSPPPTPASTGASTDPARGDGAPLLYQMAEVMETIERNLTRVRVGADRLAPLG